MAYIDTPIAKNHWRKHYDRVAYNDWWRWAFPNMSTFKQHRVEYNETVHWIQTHVPDWETKAMWRKVGNCYYINLRNERDVILFTLKFGQANFNE